MGIQSSQRQALEQLSDNLQGSLGENLRSLVLYGSSVRNDFSRSSSDINLLIVLRQDTAAAQRAIGNEVEKSSLKISPIVIGGSSSPRSMQCFALKFADIMRRDELIFGDDPFSDFEVTQERRRFLVEQGLRNTRMRLSHAYVLAQPDPQRYLRTLRQAVPRIFADLAELLRLDGSEIPDERELQAPLLARELGLEPELLQKLIELRSKQAGTMQPDIHVLHNALLAVFDRASEWMVSQWEL
ncbi:hypothetical protein KDL44_01330 [bacterium]|nr:hypothetical protein [bacterium]